MVEGFAWILSPYPVEKVINGFSIYIRDNPDIPTPADIIAIIDPKPPVWKPDKALYISLKQILKEQGPFGLDTEEIEYVKQYELHMLRERR